MADVRSACRGLGDSLGSTFVHTIGQIPCKFLCANYANWRWPGSSISHSLDGFANVTNVILVGLVMHTDTILRRLDRAHMHIGYLSCVPTKAHAAVGQALSQLIGQMSALQLSWYASCFLTDSDPSACFPGTSWRMASVLSKPLFESMVTKWQHKNGAIACRLPTAKCHGAAFWTTAKTHDTSGFMITCCIANLYTPHSPLW